MRAAAGESPYFAAKGLVIVSPLFMILALRALLAPRLEAGAAERLMVRAGAVAFVGLALASSGMALRSGYVGPRARTPTSWPSCAPRWADDGAALVLVDRRLPAVGALRRGRGQARRRPGGQGVGVPQPYDFDSVTPAELDRYSG